MSSDFKNLSDKVKPREQLRDAVSPSELKPEALLAILLRTGSTGCNVLETARRLLDAFGSVSELVKSDWRTLDRHIREYNGLHAGREIKGVGQLKMLELAAAFELVRRGYEIDGEDIRKIQVSTPEVALRVFINSGVIGDEQENFFVLPLDVKCHPMCTAPIRVTRGTVDRTPVHAREVFKSAIRWGAQSIIVAHNHPSGDPRPGQDDIRLTERLAEAAAILGIPIRDHIVFSVSSPTGEPQFFSFEREGLLPFAK